VFLIAKYAIQIPAVMLVMELGPAVVELARVTKEQTVVNRYYRKLLRKRTMILLSF